MSTELATPEQMDLTKDEAFDRIRLFRSRNVGPLTFRQLLHRYDSAGAALDALPDIAGQAGKRKYRPASAAEVKREATALKKLGGRYIVTGQASYPDLLNHLPDAPPVLTVLGNADLLHARSVALVGARNASSAGLQMAALLAEKLGESGLVTVSGMARGIDAAVHNASLNSGTIAVLGGGVDVIYPRGNSDLYRQIIEGGGCIVAESPLGTKPLARHFPRRNRIISGLSLGTVVVEAALRSGSLITARQAAEQGRDVFAVPGSPLDPRAQGANRLLKDGAYLVENAADIISNIRDTITAPGLLERPAFQFSGTPPAAEPEQPGDDARARILGFLSPTPGQIDQILRDSGLPINEFNAALLELELSGQAERVGVSQVVRLYEGA